MALLRRSLIARSPGHQPGATGCNAFGGLALASPRWSDAQATLPGTMAAMSSESSFDIVNKPDHQEIDNAVTQTARETTKRFDFKGVDAGIRWSGETIEIQANSDLRANAVLDLFKERLVRREVSLKNIEATEPVPSGKLYKITVTVIAGISQENAKKLSKLIRDSGPKGVKALVQGDELRISSKSRDDLQAVQRLVRTQDLDFAVQFVNYR
jgi:cyclic-di-GMP-binding protein